MFITITTFPCVLLPNRQLFSDNRFSEINDLPEFQRHSETAGALMADLLV